MVYNSYCILSEHHVLYMIFICGRLVDSSCLTSYDLWTVHIDSPYAVHETPTCPTAALTDEMRCGGVGPSLGFSRHEGCLPQSRAVSTEREAGTSWWPSAMVRRLLPSGTHSDGQLIQKCVEFACRAVRVCPTGRMPPRQ